MSTGKKPSLPGIDADAGLRFAGMDSALYLSFLKRFPDDDTVCRLQDALRRGDVCEAFACAHTLKGLSAQLGIVSLAKPASEICELLRAQNPAALAQASERFSVLRRRHAQLVRAIRKL